MSSPRRETAYALKWDLSLHGDDEFAAQLVKFAGWQDLGNLELPRDYSLPEQLLFEANVRTLEKVDYPYTDVRWPVMSEKMLSVLREAGDLSHKWLPVVMLDDTIPSAKRFADGAPKPGVAVEGFGAVQLLQNLDIFDPERSVFVPHPVVPEFPLQIEKLVLRTPADGFPPLFRVSAYPTAIFVSGAARDALDEAEVTGTSFVSLSQFTG